MNSEILTLLDDLSRLGIRLTCVDDNLKVDAPKGALKADIVQRIKASKAQLLEHLSQHPVSEETHKDSPRTSTASKALTFEPINSVSHDDPLPLSFTQNRFWFIENMSPSSAYLVPFTSTFHGQVNIEHLETAIQELINDHAIFRTRYLRPAENTDDEPTQVIDKHVEFRLRREDLSHLDELDLFAERNRIYEECCGQPFDLENDLMFRGAIVRLDDELYQLLLATHHITCDGWSVGLMIDQITTTYTRLCHQGNEQPSKLLSRTKPTLQYADFAVWQKSLLQPDVLEESLTYFRELTDEAPSVHQLPLDYPRPTYTNHQGNMLSFDLDSTIYQGLQQVAANTSSTAFMVMMAAFSSFLAKYSNSNDILIGSPVANRSPKETETMIGPFLNTLIFRNRLDTESTFYDAIENTKQQALDAYAHQHIPFDLVVEHLNPARSTSYSPLFQIMFTLRNDAPQTLQMPGVTVEGTGLTSANAKFDLELLAIEEQDGLSLHWIYATALFREASIEKMHECFTHYLSQLVARPKLALRHHCLVPPAHIGQQLQLSDSQKIPFDMPDTLACLFEEFAKKNARLPALTYLDQQLTFAQLNRKANQLAHELLENHDITPDTLIGVCIGRGIQQVVAILAVLKAGAAYVPIDPSYPANRVAYIAKTANMPLVLCDENTQSLESLTELDAECINVNDIHPDKSNPDNPTRHTQQHHLAYVIFTSGSTGNPKGVMIEHHSILNLAFSARQEFLASDTISNWGWNASFAFDASLKGLCALCLGVQLTVIPEELRLEPQGFFDYLLSKDVDIVDCTPAQASLYFDADQTPPPFHWVIGGDSISSDLWRTLARYAANYQHKKQPLKVYNVYGPTECCVDSTWTPVSVLTEPHIGLPVSNLDVRIVSNDKQLLPIGSVGELIVSGEGVARGYLNAQDLTNERFVSLPHLSRTDQYGKQTLKENRWYHTGDLVRWRREANNSYSLEYIGRVDNEVKVRGFRIALGEIEIQLTEHPDAKSAVVLVENDQLIAFVEANSNVSHEQLLGELKTQLSAQLPVYMLPSRYHILTSWPLTPNRKIDRAALRLHHQQNNLADADALAVAVATTRTEKVLVEIWASLLKQPAESIDIHTDFFTLGGHSLLLVKMLAAVHSKLKVTLLIKDVFATPYIAKLAAFIDQQRKNIQLPKLTRVGANSADLPSRFPLTFAQQRLWFIHQFSQGDSSHYNMPMPLHITGEFDIQRAEQAINALLQRHHSLRTVYTEDAGTPFQQVLEVAHWQLPITPVVNLEEAQQKALEDAKTPFDLGSDLMLRISWLPFSSSAASSSAQQEGVLLFNMHHIASDGWSLRILIEEFTALYCGESLPELPVQYTDFAYWQHANLTDDVLEDQLDYWTSQLALLPSVHTIPLDGERSETATSIGGAVRQTLDAKQTAALNACAKHFGISSFMLFHAALALVVSRYSYSEDVVIGTPVAGRTHSEVSSLIGFFVNTLVLRSNVQQPTLAALFEHIKTINLEAQANQDLPFEQLIDACNLPRDTAHSPLFQIMLNMMERQEGQNQSIPDLTVSKLSLAESAIKFELEFEVAVGETTNLSLHYDSNLFSQQKAERLLNSLQQVLSVFAATDIDTLQNVSLRQLSTLTANKEEKREENAERPLQLPECQNIVALFAQHAKQYPDAPALSLLTGESEASQQLITYAQLQQDSYALAQILRDQGVSADDCVGVYLHAGQQAIRSVLAILSVGACYVPLDPAYPTERLQHMIEDSGIKAIICTTDSLNGLTLAADITVINVQTLPMRAAADDLAQWQEFHHADIASARAYVIYTSGSTGKPKGVQISHQNWLSYHQASAQLYATQHENTDSNHSRRVMQFSSMSFDIFIEELSLSILSGGCLCIKDTEQASDTTQASGASLQSATEFWAQVAQQNIDTVSLPTAYWHQLCDAGIAGHVEESPLRLVIIGGEAMSHKHLDNWLNSAPEHLRLINTYGPTETTIIATGKDVSQVAVDRGNSLELDDNSPELNGNSLERTENSREPSIQTANNTALSTIGKALANSDTYLLDIHGGIAPKGSIGELAIGGPSVCLGYLNRDDQNQKAFSTLHIHGESKRVYLTGDLVQRDGDEFLFIGRKDSQVKIRGFRIEVSEVAFHIQKLERVKSCHVLVDKQAENTRLVAYVMMNAANTATQTSTPDVQHINQELREALSEHVPHYMIPSIFVVLDQSVKTWPVTRNGKVDTKALPKPDWSSNTQITTPSSPTEFQLRTLWSALLNIPEEQISANANFFELGGHSLLALRLVNNVRESFHVDVPIRQIFDTPTIQTFAQNLLATLAKQSSDHTPLPELVAGDYTTAAPLSFAQQRLWFIHKLTPEQQAQYNISMPLRIRGKVDIDKIEQVLFALIQRHSILRTCYIDEDDSPQQHIVDVAHWQMRRLSANSLDDAKQFIAEDAQTPFNLHQDLMLRATWVALGEEDGVLAFTMHHIASDGWSMQIVMQEFMTLYQNQSLAPLPVQYIDFARWQRQLFTEERLQQQLDYWQHTFNDAPMLHNLPLDFPRPSVKGSQGQRVTLQLDETTTQGLRKVAEMHQITPFMLFHGALVLLLSRHSHHDKFKHDIMLGTPVANRRHADVQSLVGLFVNTLVLRTNPYHDTLSEFFDHVKQVNLEAQSNQDVPFEQLVEHCNVERTLSHSPLFQVIFGFTSSDTEQSLKHYETTHQSFDGIRIDSLQAANTSVKFDIDVGVHLGADSTQLTLVYDVALFTQQSMQNMLERWKNLLVQLVEKPQASIADLSMFSAQERQQLLVDQHVQLLGNQPLSQVTQTLHDSFANIAHQYPQRTALVDEHQSLSYAELQQQSDALAQQLILAGVEVNDFVGLCIQRSCAMIVGLIGILKAGAVYVPIDPNAPQSRRHYIAEDSGIRLMLTEEALQAEYQAIGIQCIAQETFATLCANAKNTHSATVTLPTLGADAPAYMIYTSGSTGRPKGVLQNHENPLRLINNAKQHFGVSENDAWLLFHSIAFDFTVWELWGGLLYGGKVVIPSLNQVRDPHLLAAFCAQHEVSILNQTPNAFSTFAETLADSPIQLTSLRCILLGGEALHVRHFEAWLKKYPNQQGFYNIYGITETAVLSTFNPLNTEEIQRAIRNESEGSQVLLTTNIGKQLAEQTVLLLDEDLNPVPNGTIGEAYIGRAGLALCYHKNEELTESRFIKNPFDAVHGERLYRTGDLMRRLPNGDLDYAGRSDHQIKIRGFRIEVMEVAFQLQQLTMVKSCHIIVDTQDDNPRLIAYVMLNSDAAPQEQPDQKHITTMLRDQLGEQVPHYMLPSAFVVLDASIENWPMNSNGKIDTNALPKPDWSTNTEILPPSNDIERQLQTLWGTLLNIPAEHISIDANFFELGGHSLLALRLINAVREAFDVDLEIRQIFDAPSIQTFAHGVQAAIENNASADTTTPDLIAGDYQQPAPLSFAQQRMWFIHNLATDQQTQYNIAMPLRIRGNVDVDKIERVLLQLIQRHSILRTCYSNDSGSPQQQILDVAHWQLRRVNVSSFDAAKQLIEEDSQTPFDLQQDLMLRATWVAVGADNEAQDTDDGVLIFNIHHIASDGWSMQVVMREFIALYQGETLPPLPVQYIDFARWQRLRFNEALFQQQLDFWQTTFENAPMVHNLPLDFVRPSVKRNEGQRVSLQLDKATTEGLRKVAEMHNVTPFMLFHASLALLLSRHSHHDEHKHDIMLGTPVANRRRAEVQPLIGLFVNTLVLRTNTKHNTLAEFLDHVKQVNLDAQSNQDVPFEQLVEHCDVERTLAHSPLFQVILAFTSSDTDQSLANHDTSNATFDDISIESIQDTHTTVKFDIDVGVHLEAESTQLSWIYDVTLFTQDSIETMLAHWKHLLVQIAEKPQARLADLDMYSAHERHELLVGQHAQLLHNKPLSQVTQTLHGFFDETAEHYPHKTAVIDAEQSLTYAQLKQQSDALAQQLIAANVQVSDFVGLCMHRRCEVIVGLIAILKAGAAYVPIDPNAPQSRRHYIVESSNIRVMLTEDELQEEYAAIGIRCISPAGFNVTSGDSLVDLPQVSADHPAYMIYTSGSTGRPKGVLQTHGNPIRLMENAKVHFDFCESDTWVLFHSIAFDFSVWEVWGALLYGAKLVIPNLTQVRDPLLLAQLYAQTEVSVLNQTPNAFSIFAETVTASTIELPHLRIVIFGGEALHARHLETWLQKFPTQQRFINAYGITETTVLSTFNALDNAEITQSSQNTGEGKQTLLTTNIGKQMAEQTILLLDEDLNPVPQGTIGEAYIGRTGLAICYYGNEELTQSRFIKNPFDAIHGERLYRSGDLMRCLPNGDLDYAGRTDHQVKIRGFRIEIEEIEYQINVLPNIGGSLVQAKTDSNNNPYLTAHVVVEQQPEDHQEFIEQMLTELAKELPHYMLPSAIVLLDEFPLNTNGKIDRAKLPETESCGTQQAITAPETPLEAQLVVIWSALLKIPAEQISTQANFFSLGGHSLLAVRLIAAIREQLSLSVQVKDVFEHNTIQALARSLSHAAIVQGEQALAPLLPQPKDEPTQLSFGQRRLWFVNQLSPEQGQQYNMPIMLHIKGDFDVARAEAVFKQILERHSVLRTVFKFDEQHASSQQDGPQLHCLDAADWHLAQQPVATFAEAQEQAETQAYQRFELTSDYLLKVTWFAVEQPVDNTDSARQGVLLVNQHHIASDGWSMQVLLNEFVKLYQGQTLPALSLQYSDYAYWQHLAQNQLHWSCSLAYWTQHLAELPAAHQLPLKATRPSVKQTHGATYEADIDISAVPYSLHDQVEAWQLTPFMFLHLVFARLVSEHSASDDIVIGTPVANRTEAALESLIGFFVNTLVLRVNTQHNTIADYIDHVRDVHLQAQQHQAVGFEQIVEALNPPRSTAHTPLFQLMLTTNMQDIHGNHDAVASAFADIEMRPLNDTSPQAKFDLHLHVDVSDNQVNCQWLFDTALFSAPFIQRLHTQFSTLLKQWLHIAPQDTQQPNTLTGVDSAELHLLFNANNQQVRADSAQSLTHLASRHGNSVLTLVDVFESQRVKTPDAVAVRMHDSQLTYAQLNEQATQLAQYITPYLPTSTQAYVAVHLSPCAEVMVCLLAAMKAGAAYIPLDATQSASRLQHILDEAQPQVLITQSADHQFAINEHITCVDVEQIQSLTQAHSSEPLAALNNATPQSMAYVLFTSGSTGKPKGVQVSHKQLIHYMDNVASYLDGENAEQSVQINGSVVSTSISFDATITALYAPWLFGGYTQFIASGPAMLDQLAQCVRGAQPLLFKLTPAHLQSLSVIANEQATLSDVAHRFVVGGEAFQAALAERIVELLPAATFINEYGPTETTVGCTYASFDASSVAQQKVESNVSIGIPLNHCECYVLNSQQMMVPLGAIGELYIAGDQVAEGYLHQPELTQSRFIEHTFAYTDPAGNAVQSTKRLYRTGDLVRYLGYKDDGYKDGDYKNNADTRLAFCGRIDGQVKIRGFRIEIGEIEYQLNRIANVSGSLVQAKTDDSDSPYLVAHVVVEKPPEDNESFIDEIQHALAVELPQYMLPNNIVVMDEWPLNANGKIDRDRLALPGDANGSSANTSPQNQLEAQLVEIWSELLQKPAEQISTQATFFRLGGHSLLAVRLITAIRERLTANVQVKDIFEHNTIQALARVLSRQSEAQNKPRFTKIVAQPEDQAPMLSFGQQRLWFIDQIAPEQGQQYNMPMMLHITGDFDVKRAERIFRQIVKRHRVLRSVFVLADDDGAAQLNEQQKTGPQIQCLDADSWQLSQLQVASLDDAKQQAKQRAYQRFDLSKDYLLQATWFDIVEPSDLAAIGSGKNATAKASKDKNAAERQGVLLVNQHHIASDGWSMKILMKEFAELYQGIILPAPTLQYSDYAYWQHQAQNKALWSHSLDYWKQQLAELPVEHQLPLKTNRPAIKQTKGASYQEAIDLSTLPCSLEQQAQQWQLTPFMFLHLVFAQLISEHSASNDIVIGTPAANRTEGALESLIGFFVNTLVLRVDTKQSSLADYIAHVRDVHLQAQQHQAVGFEQIVEALNLPRSTAHTPLFQIMLTTNMRDIHAKNEAVESTFADIQMRSLSDNSPQAKFDLHLHVDVGDNDVSCQWVYDTSLFAEHFIQRLHKQFSTLLMQWLQVAPQNLQQPNRLSCVDTAEFDLLFNANQQQMPQPMTLLAQHKLTSKFTLVDVFEAQVSQNPHAVAVRMADAQLTYAQLDEQSSRLAAHLTQHLTTNVQPLVAVHLSPSIEVMLCLLAIMKSGAAYVPLDANHPTARLQQILDEAQPQVLITHSQEHGLTTNADSVCLTLEQVKTLSQTENLGAKLAGKQALSIGEVSQSTLAYVLFTSGSTGKPKGVQVTHGQLLNYMDNVNEYIDARQYQDAPIPAHTPFSTQITGSVVSTSISFDATITALYAPWLFGGYTQFVAAGPEMLDQLTDCLQSPHALLFKLTPAHLQSVASIAANHAMLSDQKHILVVGGEALQTVLAERALALLPHATLINEYGPTETTVGCTRAIVNASSLAAQSVQHDISIGVPLKHCECYVLNEHKMLVPFGAIGELYIAGDQVANGYLHQNALTEERFIEHTFTSSDLVGNKVQHTKRLYKTGDLVRYLGFAETTQEQLAKTSSKIKASALPDARLAFCGRIDDQVKIRGFRIELEEIVYHIEQDANVEKALVLVDDSNNQNPQLIAYVQLTSGLAETQNAQTQQLQAIQAHVEQHLPSYMQPNHWVNVAQWPLTPNGKIDTQALPSAEYTQPQEAYQAAETPLERELLGIWATLLNQEASTLSVTADFFTIGGHSLLAAQLMQKVRKHCQQPLPMVMLFQAPSIRKLAAAINAYQQNNTSSDDSNAQLDFVRAANAHEHGANAAANAPVILVPALGISSSYYRALAQRLAPQKNLWVVPSQGIDTNSNLNHQQRLQYYLDKLSSELPNSFNNQTIELVGHSYGGNLAFDLAQALEAQGKKVRLTLVESRLSCPAIASSNNISDLLLSPAQQAELSNAEAPATETLYHALDAQGKLPENTSLEEFEQYYQTMQTELSEANNYAVSGTLNAPVQLILAEQGFKAAGYQEALSTYLSTLAPNLTKVIVRSGEHLSVIQQLTTTDFTSSPETELSEA